jgi:phage terminase large subunit-like protein
VPYRQWAQQGFVTLTPGNQVDHSFVRRYILEQHERYAIQEIAADRWNASQIITDLAGDGLNITAFGQGFASMSGPSKELEKLILARKFRHGANPVLRWMAGNVAVIRDAAENIKPVKDKSTGRIDGIVASIMALGRAIAGVGTQWFNESNALEIG